MCQAQRRTTRLLLSDFFNLTESPDSRAERGSGDLRIFGSHQPNRGCPTASLQLGLHFIVFSDRWSYRANRARNMGWQPRFSLAPCIFRGGIYRVHGVKNATGIIVRMGQEDDRGRGLLVPAELWFQ